MAVLRRILGYEICLWEIEGNALRGIPLVLIRRNGYTEIVSFENGRVIHEMGDKITSKALMKKAGVPVIEGTPEGVSDVDYFFNIQIGFGR